MKWLRELLGEQWNIRPAGGATGEAYVGELDHKRVFLKRNSSPFLAVLAVEGIAPKLLWTKRLENGDVITAQQYLEGAKLTPEDMKGEEIAIFLKKIHSSEELLRMLKKIRKEADSPEIILSKVRVQLSEQVFIQPLVQEALKFLEKAMPTVPDDAYVVCHSDLNHHNCLKDEHGKLFLVDWDGAVIADMAMDIGTLLYSYVPMEEWDGWLKTYGLQRSADLEHRLKWYAVVHALAYMELNKDREEMFQWTNLLRGILDSDI